MNTKKLFSNFSAAIQWNSFFYILYKICYVALCFTLYSKLSPTLFSIWATGNSLVFLLLLWLDCGFRKSIPRYCPEFAQSKSSHHYFIHLVLRIQSTVLFLALPLLWLLLPYSVINSHFALYIIGIFAINGISELLRVIYNAHFWQKQFNTLQTLCVLAEMALNFFFITHHEVSEILVRYIFISKMLSGCAVILGALAMLPSLLKKRSYPEVKDTDQQKITRAFIEHSAMMWATTFIKSLSERNFLFPFLTHAVGVPQANFFKVAHDGALFFQRISVRILGAVDTALLSHVQVLDNRQALFKKAFVTLFKTVAALCIPLLFIGSFVFLKQNPLLDPSALYIFFIVSIGYMLEIFLSPYERMLEVKRRYRLLWYSYTPYLVGLGYLLIVQSTQKLSLLWFIACVHTLRLSGSFLMTFLGQKHYPMPFPKKFIGTIALACIGISAFLFFTF